MSFISGISLENFKGISSRVNISLKPLTLLFGANSAGKSTILHALLYIREVIRTGNVDIDWLMQSGESIDLGGFENIVHGHDTNRTIRIRFELNYSSADLTKRVEIDEYLYMVNQSAVDLSTIGDSVETGWIEFHIGTGSSRSKKPRVLMWEVGFDGVWFARVSNPIENIDRGYPEERARLQLNEIHPLLAIPGDENKTGTIYGEICEDTRSDMYELYFGGTSFSLPEKFDHDVLFTMLEKEYGRDVAADFANKKEHIHKPRNLFIVDSLRAALTPDSQSIIEIGELASEKCLYVYRTIYSPDNPGSYVQQFNNVFKWPIIPNVRGWCIPDWEKPFKIFWPASIKLEFESQEKNKGLNQPDLLAVKFVEQMTERLCIGPLLLLKDELSSLRYIGPIREIVSRNFTPPKTEDPSRWANGLGAWDALQKDAKEHRNPTLVNKTSDYLSNYLGLGYTLEVQKTILLPKDDPVMSEIRLLAVRFEELTAHYVKEKIIDPISRLEIDKKLQIIDQKNGVAVDPNDIGIGVSQVLPVVVGALEQSALILAVEQPELHVHPAVACNLGDLFIREFVREKRLCLIETHSEHLILRLLRRIRETTNKPDDFDESLALSVDDISVITVENNDGVVSMVEIPVREDGEFSRKWPKGFFEEREEELF